jgi:hypothetical protein
LTDVESHRAKLQFDDLSANNAAFVNNLPESPAEYLLAGESEFGLQLPTLFFHQGRVWRLAISDYQHSSQR